jgi:hypothetical protein
MGLPEACIPYLQAKLSTTSGTKLCTHLFISASADTTLWSWLGGNLVGLAGLGVSFYSYTARFFGTICSGARCTCVGNDEGVDGNVGKWETTRVGTWESAMAERYGWGHGNGRTPRDMGIGMAEPGMAAYTLPP